MSESLEIETKYDVPTTGEPAAVPDLSAVTGIDTVAVNGPFTLEATYFDTPRLDLARNKATLRRRTGGTDAGWHLKLPAPGPGHTAAEGKAKNDGKADSGADHGGVGTAGASGRGAPARREIHAPLGRVAVVPKAFADLLAPLTRNRPLAPIATLRTERTTYTATGAGELADDWVRATVLVPGVADPDRETSWREWEFEEVPDASGKLVARIDAAIRAAGAVTAAGPSKLVRALGPIAPPPAASPADGDPLITAIARSRDALLAWDPLVRTNAEDGVHQARVALRQLRSLLRIYHEVLPTAPELTAELRELAGILGQARDAEVLIAELEPLASDPVIVTYVLEPLHAQHRAALARVAAAYRDERYFALLDALDALILDPPYPGGPPKKSELKRIVGARSRKLVAHTPETNAEWHDLRKRGKAVRYALAAIGKSAPRSLTRLQTELGIFQDAHILIAELDAGYRRALAAGADTFIFGREITLAEVRADAARERAARLLAAPN